MIYILKRHNIELLHHDLLVFHQKKHYAYLVAKEHRQ